MVVGVINFRQTLIWVMERPLTSTHSVPMINQQMTELLSTNSTIRKVMDSDTT